MRRKILIIISVLLIFASCKNTKEVSKLQEQQEVKTEQTSRQEKDSVFVLRRDSVIVKQTKDTVYLEKIRYEYKYRIEDKVDTVIKTDTVYKSLTQERVVEDKQKVTQLSTRNKVLLCCVIVLIGVVIWQVLSRYIKR